jgi:DDHD domain
MLASRPPDGLLGLDRSIDFSSRNLDHRESSQLSLCSQFSDNSTNDAMACFRSLRLYTHSSLNFPSFCSSSTVFLVIHGVGEQYADSPPWLTSLNTSIAHLQRLITRLHEPRSSAVAPALSAPQILLVPLEYHAFAQRELSRVLAPVSSAAPAPNTVRAGVEDTVGDILLAASPHFRGLIGDHLKTLALDQIAAAKRARPAFQSGRVSIFAHSTGAVFTLDMLHRGLLDDLPGLDAVVLAGSPAPAYAALDPPYANSLRDAIIARRKDIRLINVWHPMDPVGFRLEPWLVVSPDGNTTAVQPPVRVGQLERQSFLDEAASFWEGTVQSVLSALFPHREAKRGPPPTVESTNNPAYGSTGSNSGSEGDGSSSAPFHLSTNRLPKSQSTSGLKRVRSYKLAAAAEDGEDLLAGCEVLLGDRVDYELQEGMQSIVDVDVVVQWAAVKAHGYYWHSPDTARILVDIARTATGGVAEP